MKRRKRGAAPVTAAGKPKTRKKTDPAPQVTFTHPDGRTWDGHGELPGWVLDALQEKRFLECLDIPSVRRNAVPATGGRVYYGPDNQRWNGRGDRPKWVEDCLAGGMTLRELRDPREAAAKYLGPRGEEWSGRGRRPRWLLEELEGGRSLEDFLNPAFTASEGGEKN